MKLESYHVMGNSMGAYLAARLALEDVRVVKFVTTTSGTLAPKGSAESQALGQKHSEELREYVPSLENMRELTLGTLFRKELVTEELVRARHEMSVGKNQEAALLRRGAKPPRPLFNASNCPISRRRRCFSGAPRTAAFRWSEVSCSFNLSPTRSFTCSTSAPTGYSGIRRCGLTIWSPVFSTTNANCFFLWAIG